jgi:hypothetical protein
VISRHGLDPDSDSIPYLTARAVTRAINRRVRVVWRLWDWPDFTITEERAYRQVWNATTQFYRTNSTTGKPDDVFHIPSVTYYTVNTAATQDPPVGTPPVSGTPAVPSLDPSGNPYYVATAPLDAYVSFDTICKKSIGRVIGIYKTNPRLDGFKHSGITFRVTEMGIDLFQVSTPTIFVKYLPAPSKFTMVPYVAGKTYNVGDLVFWFSTGETYLSISGGNTQIPSNTAYWRVMPMPEVLAPYVEAGAYADCMRESHPVDKDLAQFAAQQAAAAEQEASELLQREIDVLMGMGQRHSYQQHRPPRRWTRSGLVQTPTWQPGTVTTLTDACDKDGLYPGITVVTPQSELGSVPLISGQDYINVVFQTVKANASWWFSNLDVENTLDVNPLKIYWTTVTNRTTTGFTVLLNAAPNTANYVLNWAVNQPVPAALSVPTPGEGALTPLINGQNFLLVNFLNVKPLQWDFVNLTVENTVDPSPSAIYPTICTVHSATQFKIFFNAAPATANYNLRWRVNYP